jgi:hypothetical protein
VAFVHNDLSDSISSVVYEVYVFAVTDVPTSLTELLINENSCSFLGLFTRRHTVSLNRGYLVIYFPQINEYDPTSLGTHLGLHHPKI